ncbi:MAG: DoxX family protein [Candidatus Omnitrophica bacterium]|nr:DoxX family protein [Candidatus Omnitrophota bacterium]
MKDSFEDKAASFGILCLRVLFGAGLAYHGALKIFGGKMDGFVKGVAALGFPMPEFFAWSAVLSEFAGGILIVLGLYTRQAAFFAAVTMGVAVFVRHAQDPFAVKELAAAYGTAAMALVLTGPGRFSLDRRGH